MARIVWDPAFPAHLHDRIHDFMDDDLGPQIDADAKMYCPKDTGALADSIDHEVEAGNTLIVSAGPWEPGLHGHPGVHPYAAYVELGHVNSRDRHGTFRRADDPRVASGPHIFYPQPFLRPALYTERTFRDF